MNEAKRLSRPLRPRLGRHHFAHLRAVAQGMAISDSAHRYLGIDHGHEARLAHQRVLDQVRSLALRRHDPAWRLIGLRVAASERSTSPTLSLEDFIAEQGLEGFSEREVAALYAEAHPADPRQARRARQLERLMQRQLELLKRLEEQAAEVPLPTDAVHGWFEPVMAGRLVTAGFVTLADLARAIAAGGRWYRGMPGFGATKAKRLEHFLGQLLPAEVAASPRTRFSIEPVLKPETDSPNELRPAIQGTRALDTNLASSFPSSSSSLSSPLLDARSDTEAINAWIAARVGSDATRKLYAREALRLCLWLHHERGGKQLSSMQVGDCRDFMAFLENIPERWISRARAAPGEKNWAPFKGQLSHASRKQSVVILCSLFAWLQSAQYLASNPWLLINRDFGDDAGKKLLDTRSFSEEAIQAILEFIEEHPPSPSRSRIRFLIRFVEAVGLRSSELLNARLSDIQAMEEGWMIQVMGKGSRQRLAAIPGQGMQALTDYLESRHLNLESAPPETPLVASVLDSMQPVGYTPLYQHVRGWLRKAVTAASLPQQEKSRLQKASTHWLRHTFGTRAVARQVPLDVIQAQMGHASINTTMMYGRAPLKRRVEELAGAFGGSKG